MILCISPVLILSKTLGAVITLPVICLAPQVVQYTPFPAWQPWFRPKWVWVLLSPVCEPTGVSLALPNLVFSSVKWGLWSLPHSYYRWGLRGGGLLKPPLCCACHMVRTWEIVAVAVNDMNDPFHVFLYPATWCTWKRIYFTFVFQKIEVTGLFPFWTLQSPWLLPPTPPPIPWAKLQQRHVQSISHRCQLPFCLQPARLILAAYLIQGRSLTPQHWVGQLWAGL